MKPFSNFHFRPVLTAVCLVALGILLSLGKWQLDRLVWKQKLIDQVEARLDSPPIPFDEARRRADNGEWMEYSPVTLAGRGADRDVAVVFGSYEAAAGGFYFSPVEVPTGEVVYINRGFVPQAILKEGFATKRHAESKGEVIGLFRYRETPTPPASWFQTNGKSADGLWFVRDPLAFASAEGARAVPYYIDELAVEGREWPKGGTTRVEFSNRHLEYALTWFGLAATLMGVWLAFSLQKRS